MLGISGQIDTIVRFHDAKRLSELERCIFSLTGQTYRPLRIILVLQRFSDAEIAATKQMLAPLLNGPHAPDLSIVPWNEAGPADARSHLLNAGLAKARGRYLAFLDYDDALYPDAYSLMIARLVETGAAIAFAAVRTMRLGVYQRFCHQAGEFTPPFSGQSLADLFRANFCPLHSYVIDRAQVPDGLLCFTPALTMEEDYDLLLRLCAALPSDFGLIGYPIGEYYFKTDASNSVAVGGLTGAAREHYLGEVKTAIERRRRQTAVSPRVQQALGLRDVRGGRTVREIVDALGSTP